jgi:uncharacterized protein (TIGR03067 family)
MVLGSTAGPVHAQKAPGPKPPEDKVNAELARLEGQWQTVRLRNLGGDGDLSAEEARQQGQDGWDFKDGIAYYRHNGKAPGAAFSVAIAPEKRPKTIDLTAMTGAAKGHTFYGIYAFESGKLHIRYSRPKRPSSNLDDPPGAREVDWVLERRKD